MGRNSIERGSRDTWTMSPRRIADIQALIAKERQGAAGGGRGAQEGDAPSDSGFGGGGQGQRGAPLKYYEMLRKPEDRDPRGYIIPSDQVDFLTATKFVNALIKTGITVTRATAIFRSVERPTRRTHMSSNRHRHSGRISSTCLSRRITQ
jgi:hypothetical protein